MKHAKPRITAMQQQAIRVVGGAVAATADAVNMTAEIKTGERRVIEYLLSPIQRVGSESVQER